MTAGKDLIHQVIDLVLTLADLNLRIQQACGSDDLFYYDSLGLCQLVVGRGGTNVDDLIDHLVELIEGQRPVVESGRQTETVFHQVRLSGAVAPVHSINLWDADMTFIDNQQVVLGEEIQQTIGSFSGLTTIEVAAVVLDTRTMPQFLNHLHVVLHTFLNTLGFDGVAHLLKKGNLFSQVVLDVVDGDIGLFLRRHKEIGGVELIALEAG